MNEHSFKWPNPARRLRVAKSLAEARTIGDLRLMARRRLPNFMYEYLEGGADGEHTLRRNAAAPDQWLWLPRMALDVTTVDTSATLLGASVRLPVVIAPTGFNGMLWHQGDLELARAAARAGIPAAQSTVSMNTIAEIAAVPGLRHWFQLYAYGGAPVVERLLEHALAAGTETLVVTIDGAVAGNRVWDQRSYAAPGQLNWRSKIECLRHPRWLRSVILAKGPPNFVNLLEFADAADPSVYVMGRWIAAHRPVLSWEDISPNPKGLAAQTRHQGHLASGRSHQSGKAWRGRNRVEQSRRQAGRTNDRADRRAARDPAGTGARLHDHGG